MNKLLIIPLTFMLITTIIGMLYDPNFDFLTSQTAVGNSTIGGNNTTVNVPGSGTFSINIDSSAAIMAIMACAIGVGVIAGFSLFGSGLSDTSQTILFNSVIFLGLWGVLSLFASNLIFVDTVLTVLWIGLTIIYLIGLSIHMMGTEAGDS